MANLRKLWNSKTDSGSGQFKIVEMRSSSISTRSSVTIKARKRIRVTLNRHLLNFAYNPALRRALNTSRACFLC